MSVDIQLKSQHCKGMMMRCVLTVALVLASVGNAMAASKSKVVTYPVAGTSAKAIYESIKKTSPRVAGNSTFAFTMPFTKTVSATLKQKNSCRYSRFSTSSYFIYTLPRLTKTSSVPPLLASKWSKFATYLKVHEEGHGTIWRGCLAEYDEGALALTAKTCEALDKKRETLFTAVKKRCLKKDEAFDFLFRKDVLKQPFVKAALGKEEK